MKYNKFLIVLTLLAIFIGSFVVRLYKFNNPVADWHSWRQADTAAVTRNFIKEGYTPFYPKFDALNSLNERQLPNPKRYFFAEFPIYNSLVYFAYTAFGNFTIEQWGRLVSILVSSLTTVVLYFLAKEYSSKRIGLLSAFVFGFLPYNIYYGRVIMPDPLHIFASVLTLLLVTHWVKTEKILIAILAGVVFAITILTKPYGLVLILPISYLILRKWKFIFYKQYSIYVAAAIALIPFLLWRNHIAQYPEGMFGTTWLFNQGNIRFKGAFFRYLIYDRMNRLIFATGGFVLFWLGIIKGNSEKEGFFYYLWLISIFVFFTIIAKGNVTHDYYQMPLVTIGSIFIAKGIDYLIFTKAKFYQRVINTGVAASLVLFMLAFGWFEVRGYFNINNPAMVEAGQAVDKLLPKDAKVIAPLDFDSAFLYQTNRYGFTYGGDKIPQFISEGATHLVSVNYDETTNMWMKKCKVVKKTANYVIIDLKNCINDNKTALNL
ncbi:MAG TPA: glycosyltransferase family 39 protein [Candidatus Limnocylindrales bacterium]|nr:glycosyltransferase family 39 protein [Candidatus Limnocylindrales bacterium]